MAIVCAYVPGASRLKRRSSGRLRSDHSSSVRSVSTPANCSAPGSSIMAIETDATAFSAPQPRAAADVDQRQVEREADGDAPRSGTRRRSRTSRQCV